MCNIFTLCYVPAELGILKTGKLGVRSKSFCFLKRCRIMGIDELTIVVVMQAVGQARHHLSR